MEICKSLIGLLVSFFICLFYRSCSVEGYFGHAIRQSSNSICYRGNRNVGRLDEPNYRGITSRNVLHSSNEYDLLRSELRGTSIYLVGMMGSGKSSVGKVLADKLSYRHLDSDETAEYMIEMPISKYFSMGQEPAFRDLEHQILMHFAQYRRVVASTGGGIVMNNNNWGLLRHGLVIFLDVSPEIISLRLLSDPEEISKRPLLTTDDPVSTLKEIREKRMEKYMQADLHLKLDKPFTLEETTDLLATELLKFIRSNPPLWQQWKEKKRATETSTPSNESPEGANIGSE